MKTTNVEVAAGASTGVRLRRRDESAGIAALERGQYVAFAKIGKTSGERPRRE
jgi:hypothetical protein